MWRKTKTGRPSGGQVLVRCITKPLSPAVELVSYVTPLSDNGDRVLIQKLANFTPAALDCLGKYLKARGVKINNNARE